MGIGDVDWGLGPITNPQSPNTNTHKLLYYFFLIKDKKDFK